MKQQAFVSEILVDFTMKSFGSGQSDEIRGMVRKLLIDKIGLTIAGAKFPWSEGSYRATTAFPAQGRSTVIYFGDLLSPEQAAFVNASSGNAQDYDDTNIAIKIHAGGVVIPAALAVGESERRSPDQIARALVLGIEVMTRLGAGIPNSHLNGFHTPDVVGPFGAGIAAGLLLGLDKTQMMNMMGICGSFSGGVEAWRSAKPTTTWAPW
ncbi:MULTISPECIES: MmgE/PrpD family protein [Chromatiaceae]|jgi:2-methylcitrate dehydratase PrpD|uniref:MmgE/PrpD family protein n=1 Tax=Chromatiaceae TaxID=1046 RepID=UPI0025D13F57|nr:MULTISPECIES: MmgE/PrpD family protein [Chromatiaceae]